MKDSAIQNRIVYDDSCLICTQSMELLKNNNGMKNTKFVKCSSVEGQQLIESLPEKPDSILYFKGSSHVIKSEAIIQILIDRGGFFRLAKILRIIPVSILDKAYEYFAKRRHMFKLHP
jgi:predicted DCC family thiol-disulfide oxidoreductase YuxK